MRRHKRAVERDALLVQAAVEYAQKLEERCQAILNSCSEPPSMTDALPQEGESFQESQIFR